MRTESNRPSWLSYDSVADIYQRVAVPWFTQLARELVAVLDPQRNERVLDVGTGTGLASREILRAEPTARVVGVDPSVGMLGHQTASASRVAGMAPGLPFAPATFHAVVANLSVSHFGDRDAGVADIARVLRPGGRFALTAWRAAEADGPDNVRTEADQIVGDVRDRLRLDWTPPEEAAPWEEWLRDSANLCELLSGAGFASIDVLQHRSPWTFTVEEFLSGWGSRGRYLRHAAGEERWSEFVREASDALHDRFSDHVGIVNVAWIALATKPGPVGAGRATSQGSSSTATQESIHRT